MGRPYSSLSLTRCETFILMCRLFIYLGRVVKELFKEKGFHTATHLSFSLFGRLVVSLDRLPPKLKEVAEPGGPQSTTFQQKVSVFRHDLTKSLAQYSFSAGYTDTLFISLPV